MLISKYVLSAMPLLAAAQGTMAQTTAGDALRVEEIIVTARRQEENIQSTPVAVTALTPEAMERGQIEDVVDLQSAAPNVSVVSGGAGNSAYAYPSIRGQSGLAGTASADPAVGVYVDGVYIGRPGGALMDFVDVERVEVLRGPQGTLFGRNTTGGALNIVSKQPEFDDFSGSVKVKTGNFDSLDTTGVINIPLMDNLAARVAYLYSAHEGYVDNEWLDDAVGNRHNRFYRVSLKWRSADGAADLYLGYDRSELNDNGQSNVFLDYNPFSAIQTYATRFGTDIPGGVNSYRQENTGFRTNTAGDSQFNESVIEGVSAIANVDFGTLGFKSITAYRELDSSGLNDPDGSPYRLLRTGNFNDQHQLQQELQLTGEHGAFSWIGGAFYFEEEATEATDSDVYIFQVLTGAPRRTRNLSTANNKSYAAYGQLYYQLTDALRLSGGLRYTKDQRELEINNLSQLLPAPQVCGIPVQDRDDGVSCAFTRSTDFDYTSYLLGADYQLTDDAFLYVKTSKAYLAGGFNTRAGDVPAFEPEEITDYEVGAKIDWLEGRLRTNASVFYIDQKNLQRSNSGLFNNQPFLATRNIGGGNVKGAELEVTLLPWEGMTLGASVGLLDSKYTDFDEVQANPIPGGNPFVVVDRSDETPLASPDYTYTFAATQTLPLAWGLMSLHVDYAYIDDQVFFSATAAPGASPTTAAVIGLSNELAVTEGYGVLNATVSMEFDNRITVGLWGRNLADEEYYTRVWTDQYSSLGFPFAFVGAPRTYGLSLSYEF